jgi:hypothetical protein
MIETPQSFVVRVECEKVTSENGFRLELGEVEGWACNGSTTAKGRVWLAAAGQHRPWFSPKLTTTACAELRWHHPIPLTAKHRARLAWHRANPFALNL